MIPARKKRNLLLVKTLGKEEKLKKWFLWFKVIVC